MVSNGINIGDIMDVVLGEEIDRLSLMLKQLKALKGRPTKDNKVLRATLEQQLEARKIANNAGVQDEFARLLNSKPADQYVRDAIVAGDPRVAGARLENIHGASRPMFSTNPQLDTLRQLAGQPVYQANYNDINQVRGRAVPSYPSNYNYGEMSPPPIPEEPPMIKKDPISVTGTTAGDKKLNEAIKADDKSVKAGVAADKATGGLWSKIKAIKPMTAVKGFGAFSGGATIGNTIGRAIAPEGYEDFGGNVGGLLGGVAGGALTATPYVGTGLALLGAGNIAMNMFGGNDAPPVNNQPTLEQMAGAIATQPKEIDKLGEILQALAQANMDVTNMRSDTKQRMFNRGNAAANIDPELLR